LTDLKCYTIIFLEGMRKDIKCFRTVSDSAEIRTRHVPNTRSGTARALLLGAVITLPFCSFGSIFVHTLSFLGPYLPSLPYYYLYRL
jgi:hypothetical protein